MAVADRLVVRADGFLVVGSHRYPCALGRDGIGGDKQEGDGRTPVGRYPLRRVYFRSDRLNTPRSGLPVTALRPRDGWCDDPADAAYNRLVELPFAGRHEIMWRDDGLYDLVVAIGYNDAPPVPGRGSAIFIHVARPGYAPTEGCVALARDDLLAVLVNCGPQTMIEIQAD